MFIFSRRVSKVRTMFCVGLAMLMIGTPRLAPGICGLDRVAIEQLRGVRDPEAMRAITTRINLFGTCSLCHLAASGGPRNEFGTAVNVLLTVNDRENPVRQREVGMRLRDLLANPTLPDSPTFSEAFERGEFPGSSLSEGVQLSGIPARASMPLTVTQAQELVERAQAASSFGMLQINFCDEVSPEVAIELARFQGDALILSIKSMTPEVAAALSGSRAANVWLPSLTQVSPDAAQAISELSGHLILTGLAELDSVPLARKLASRNGALSFPFLKSLSPSVAAALAEHEGSLTLGGLEEVPGPVQQELAQARGRVTLPTLKRIEVEELVAKLASGVTYLPQLQEVTAQQLLVFANERGALSFFGGVHLPLNIMTPELAAEVAELNIPFNLILHGQGPISDQAFAGLFTGRIKLYFPGIETLTPEQSQIVAESGQSQVAGVVVLSTAGNLFPKLKRLDSPSLAIKLGGTFPSVNWISPAAAEALGKLPETEVPLPDGTYEVRRTGQLKFPSLEELPPDIAELLLQREWASISMPSLQEVSVDSVRLLIKQTSVLTLGLPTLPPEFAELFSEYPQNQIPGGGSVTLPRLTEISPESARLLVAGLNRGSIEVLMNRVRISRTPKLFLGGDYRFSTIGHFKLTQESAAELAKYEGNLSIQGLTDFPDAAAQAFAPFPGPYLILSGPAIDKLTPAAAEGLAQIPGVLNIELRELDSPQLAARLAEQINWTLNHCEIVSDEAAPLISKYRQFFDLRMLTVLDSPDLARRFVEGTTTGSSITLPALQTITPEAAAILARGAKPMHLGLSVIDSEAVALSLASSTAKVALFRLRAVTPEVLAILQQSQSVELPQLDALFVLERAPTVEPN